MCYNIARRKPVRKFLALLTDRNVLNFIWRDLADMMIFITPILICFLIFCREKYKQRKNMFFNFVKYGMWIGSGQQ